MLALLLALTATPLAQDVETLTETLADGTVVECEVVRDASGDALRHGGYAETWPDGSRKATGRYKDGRLHGKWRAWHADRENAASGSYKNGLRNGKWTVWRADGSVVASESGEFEALELEFDSGAVRSRGEARDGVRHGAWTFYWENGVPMAGGAYVEGELSGPWWFRHGDGTLDAAWISGAYSSGLRVGPLPDEVAAEQAARSVALPKPRRGSTAAEVDKLLGRLRGDDERRREKAREELWEQVLDDAFLAELLVRLDPEDEGERVLAEDLVAARIEPLWTDYLLWAKPAEPVTAEAGRLVVLRWASFTLLADAEYRAMGLAFEHAAARAALLESGAELAPLTPVVHPPLSDGSRTEATSRVARSPYRGRFAERGKGPEREALDRALAWLVAHQEQDGSWNPAGFSKHCPGGASCSDPGEAHTATGATALAVLALLGDGHTPSTGVHRQAVGRAVRWLVQAQDAKTGIVGERMGHAWIYNHAAATIALAEAVVFSNDPALRAAAQTAVDVVLRARNPYSAWRYDMPPSGENDTSVTGWMVVALVSAERAGLVIDPDAIEGGLLWIEQVTDTESGRCGYDVPGSFSARIERVNTDYPPERGEAMTGVALLLRLLAGQSPSGEVLVKHAQLMLERPPKWEPELRGCDMYYWYYASLAMYQMPEKEYWRPWWAALKKTALESQRADGHADGSWDPVGPWGYAAGRIYSTAIMALCLETPRRYVPLFPDER